MNKEIKLKRNLSDDYVKYKIVDVQANPRKKLELI